MSVFYAFIADIAIFGLKVNYSEAIGAGIILFFNYLAVKNKLKK
jgi:hypothetical protein